MTTMITAKRTPSKSVSESDGFAASDGLTGATAKASDLPAVINFESLATCGDEIWIRNGGQVYRLRRTKQGKLILTK
ncbi:MAG: hemin uptake protein HemP [Planctomycetota bacterium]